MSEKKDNYRNGENVGIRNRNGQREFFDTKTGKSVEGKVYNTDEHPQGPAVRHYSPESQFMFVRKTEIPTLSPKVQQELDEERRIILERRARAEEERRSNIEKYENGSKEKNKEEKNKDSSKSSNGEDKADKDTSEQHNDDKIVINVTSKGLAKALQDAGVKDPLKVANILLKEANMDEKNTPKEFRISKEMLGAIPPQASEALSKGKTREV